MTDDTVLVSVMAVNNEIGVEQPIAEIGMYIIEGVGNIRVPRKKAFSPLI